MKKILLFLFILSLPVYSMIKVDLYRYDNFLNTLKLSNNQKEKIQKVEEKYSAILSKLNAQVLLNDMQIAQLRVNPAMSNKINSIIAENNSIKDELDGINKQKQKEILSNLNIIQKFKYKKYIAKKN